MCRGEKQQGRQKRAGAQRQTLCDISTEEKGNPGRSPEEEYREQDENQVGAASEAKSNGDRHPMSQKPK